MHRCSVSVKTCFGYKVERMAADNTSNKANDDGKADNND